MDANLQQRLTAEFIGTFFLMLTITMAVTYAGPLAPLAIGAGLTVMVFACGHISGAHFNPAVSLAIYLRGQMSLNEMWAYFGAEISGAAAASLVFLVLEERPAEALSPTAGDALLVELLFTFALVWVILNVATSKGTEGNSFYGLAIGFTVMTGAFAVGAVSGGAFNPAVAIGAVIAGLIDAGSIWIYLICFVGGAIAAYTFAFASPEPAETSQASS